jgi:tetratricopeptide (TPR) repeat protein
MRQVQLSLCTYAADDEFTQALLIALTDAGARVYLSAPGPRDPVAERARRELSVQVIVIASAALALPEYEALCREVCAPRFTSPRALALVVLADDLGDRPLWDVLRPLPCIAAAPGVALPPAEALHRTMQLLALDDTPPDLHHTPLDLLAARGLALLDMDRPAEAQSIFEFIISQTPEDVMAWLRLTYALIDLKRPAEATAANGHAFALAPDSADVWRQQGILAYTQNRFADALTIFDHALVLAPDNIYSRRNRGNALLSLERYEDAIAAYLHALEIDPANTEVLRYVARALIKLQRMDEAFAIYDRLIALGFAAEIIAHDKGHRLAEQRRYSDALAAFEAALALTPEEAHLWHDKAHMLYRLQRMSEALAAIDQALARDPTIAWAWNTRGTILLKLGQYDDALAALLTSAQRTKLQSATADVVAQPVGARMVLSINTVRSLSLLAPWSVNL